MTLIEEIPMCAECVRPPVFLDGDRLLCEEHAEDVDWSRLRPAAPSTWLDVPAWSVLACARAVAGVATRSEKARNGISMRLVAIPINGRFRLRVTGPERWVAIALEAVRHAAVDRSARW